MMQKSLRSRKHELVSSAIYEAAIELFAHRGFDETTVDDVAKAAGVSRRSFFRYFASKDDLLAQSVVSYGAVLASAIERAPAPLSALELLCVTTAAGVEYTVANEARTRQVVEISARSPSARQAHGSRLMHVEDMLSEVIAKRFGPAKGNTMQSRLAAGIALAIMSATILSWAKGEFKDIPSSAEHVLKGLFLTFAEPAEAAGAAKHTPGRRRKAASARTRPADSKRSRRTT
jgi:AcrR family transcriptional regulator